MDAKYKCKKCGKDYAAKEVRISGKDLMTCVYCLGIQQPDAKILKNEPEKKEEYIEYSCAKCHYAFKRKKSALIESCPYCSNSGTLSIKSGKKADDLLKESLDRRFDF